MKKGIFGVASVIILCLSLVACQSNTTDQASKADNQYESIKKAGVVRVGMCPEYPPFETINSKGEIEGFDVDLANAIGEKLGLKMEFVNTPYEGLIAGLKNNDFDLIMSGMSPREADAADKSLNVTDSYYAVDEIVMTKDESIKNKEDLDGKKSWKSCRKYF